MASPALHGIMLGWTWEPSVLIGLGLLTLLYEVVRSALAAPVAIRSRLAFHAGTLVVFLGLTSPLDAIGDHVLFSAHMAQHMLFLYLGPLLWLLGVPTSVAEALASPPFVRRALRLLSRPIGAGLLWTAILWIWHVPALYDAALRSEGLHIFEHLTFLVAGVVGWWPAFGPWPRSIRSEPGLWQALYLFLITLTCTALAALLTLSPRVLYGFYGQAPLLAGISPLADQQLGGLLMWLPGDMLFVTAILSVLIRWLESPGARAPQRSLVPSEVA